jgi:hypothetical protein
VKMKKQYITPATAVIKVETTPIMAGSDPKTYDSENLSQGENPGMEGPITDAGA